MELDLSSAIANILNWWGQLADSWKIALFTITVPALVGVLYTFLIGVWSNILMVRRRRKKSKQQTSSAQTAAKIDKYYCYISEEKVDQLLAQRMIEPNQAPPIDNSKLMAVVTDRNIQFSNGNRVVFDRRGRKELVLKLHKLIDTLTQQRGGLPHLRDTMQQEAGNFPTIMQFDEKFRVLKKKEGVAELTANLEEEWQLNFSCSMRYFSDSFGIGQLNKYVHSGNYHFFEGKVTPRFQGIMIVISTSENTIFATPLFLCMSLDEKIIL